jgi:cytochrome c peroxidase
VTKRVFTQDLMSRTVSVFDGARLLNQGLAELPRLTQIATVGAETLSPAVLKGKQIFYNAEDPRMSRDGYISCAGCHLDGEHDGRVWDFTDRAEGLRNTTALRGQGGNANAPLHWTGNFDEVQDFENDIRSFFGGSGFMADADFLSGTRSQPLGDSKTGVSADLDALATYLNSLTDAGRSPARQSSGAMTAGAVAGKALFNARGCQSCHSGSSFSDSNTRVRHDVGTLKPSSGQRAGAPLDGLDTPTLLRLWATGPYLHDGSAATVRDVLTTANPTGRHGDLSTLSPAQIDQLTEYLMQLDSQPQ